jgi:hypothetical protein
VNRLYNKKDSVSSTILGGGFLGNFSGGNFFGKRFENGNGEDIE